MEITQVESQLAAIHNSLQTALETPRGRQKQTEKVDIKGKLLEARRKPRSRSQPASRINVDNVQIISINEEGDEKRENNVRSRPSCVSRIFLNDENNSRRVGRPELPEKPKDINILVERILKTRKHRDQSQPSKKIVNHSLLNQPSGENDQPAHQSETPSEIVTTIQFEILKLISEKDDLVKENEALKHYRESFIKLQEENALLRERLELMQIIPSASTEKEKQLWTSPAWRRSSPDGQEDLSEKVKKEFKEENRRRL